MFKMLLWKTLYVTTTENLLGREFNEGGWKRGVEEDITKVLVGSTIVPLLYTLFSLIITRSLLTLD